MFKKIVVTGPESTGKSTLCRLLAQHYNTLWVPEFARQYLEENGTDYTYDNLLTIAKAQVALEDEYAFTKTAAGQQTKDQLSPADPGGPSPLVPLIIDTDMYVMKVWCEFVFNKCPTWVLNAIAAREYDLYLLCNVDLRWVKDDLREYPDLEIRTRLYHYYKDHMVNQQTPWIDISGDYAQRLQRAIDGIDSLIAAKNT